MKVYTFSQFGYEGSLVEVEVDLRRGTPAVDIVGLADACVKDTRERVKAAFRNSQIDFPEERVLVSFSPADLLKRTPMDLAMALAIINQQKPFSLNEKVLVIGELELSGKVREGRGTYSAIQTAKDAGIKKVIIPKSKEIESFNFGDIEYIEAGTLTEAVEKLNVGKFSAFGSVKMVDDTSSSEREIPSVDLRGYSKAVRAISIAVAGKLNILAYSAPGCGKTMLLQGLIPYLTPCLTVEELESVKRLYALAGMEYKTNNAPFRMPHQTASVEGMCGGGPNLRPGEISLAHNGTLFLDEAAEFRTIVLQMLRVPLESKSITLSRAGRSTIFPANFQLAMAVNPCPCGNYGEKDKICLCSARAVEMYWNKFSAPLLNRVQIKIHVEKDESETESVSLEKLREQVANAYRIQREVGKFNRDLDLSGDRRKSNVEKVALTIANMDNRRVAEQCDIDEAEELVKNPFYL